MLTEVLDRLAADRKLWSDFAALCDCGGRLAGTPSEARALAWARGQLEAIDPAAARSEAMRYAGWRLKHAQMQLLEPAADLTCKPLLGSASTSPGGLVGEVVDLGTGRPEDFDRIGAAMRGRIALVRHEYPFAATHFHRRRKLTLAHERGAIGFIIANPVEDSGPVSGSSGRAAGQGIPAVATDAVSARRLAAQGNARARVRIAIDGEDYEASTETLVLDLPGLSDEWVVLSAHIDGHDLAESAMDNGSGVAVALAVTRSIAAAFAVPATRPRLGLRVCLFSAEEWALAGSRRYLETMIAAERARLRLNVNLDTVAGDDTLTALTSEFIGLEQFVARCTAQIGVTVGIHRPLLPNSDHANFAHHGIPALRLIAGFDRPQSNVRHILTGADTRERVSEAELRHAARVAAALTWLALNAPPEALSALR